jgi:polysaccharide export outer membrane protein
MNCKILALLGITVVVLTACQTPGPQFDARSKPQTTPGTNNLASVSVTNKLDPQWLRPATNLFTLGPGDRMEVEVLGDPTTRSSSVVGPDGKMYYFLLSGLNVWGLTLGETKTLLERELAMYFREPPKVALTLRSVQSKRVWLLGRFNTPGIYTLTNSMTLLESVSLAGGPTTPSPLAALAGGATAGLSSAAEDAADLRRSFVIRKGRLLPVDFERLIREGDLSQNIYLEADDFIYMPAATVREVHVLGAVAQPRAIGYDNSLTLVGAISKAGGSIKDAYLSHVAIVRGSLAAPQIAVVDFRAIVKGQATDVRLEPRDIVYVPISPYQTVTRYAELIVNTFVRTVGANEGARAVSRGAAPIGINVPISP